VNSVGKKQTTSRDAINLTTFFSNALKQHSFVVFLDHKLKLSITAIYCFSAHLAALQFTENKSSDDYLKDVQEWLDISRSIHIYLCDAFPSKQLYRKCTSTLEFRVVCYQR